MSKYVYQRLDLKLPSFRLMRLFPGQPGTDIRCEIFEALLYRADGSPDFEALSYAWGDPTGVHEIIVNGGTMMIARNLYTALQHLHLEYEDRILWVDALCINQNDLREKGHQVQQMGDIYKEASKVLVWLGVGTKGTDYLMDTLRQLHKESLHHACRDWTNIDPRWKELWCSVLTGCCQTVDRFQFIDLFQYLCAAPWFNRVWVIQEIANARVADIVCGTKSVSARIFALSPWLLDVEVSERSSVRSVLDVMPGPSRKFSWWAQERTLSTLLYKFRHTDASDDRDHIFALTGLSSDASASEDLQADYTITPGRLARLTISFILGLPNNVLQPETEQFCKTALHLGRINIAGALSEYAFLALDPSLFDYLTSLNEAGQYLVPIRMDTKNRSPDCPKCGWKRSRESLRSATHLYWHWKHGAGKLIFYLDDLPSYPYRWATKKLSPDYLEHAVFDPGVDFKRRILSEVPPEWDCPVIARIWLSFCLESNSALGTNRRPPLQPS